MTRNPLDLRPTLLDDGLNIRSRGYFLRAIPRDEPRLNGSPEASRWFELQDRLAQLRNGDFSANRALLRCVRESNDWSLKTVALHILGDTGTEECFRELRAEIESLRKFDIINVEARELILLACRAFAAWGRLDVVPVLMDQYLTLRIKGTPEIALLPLLMADLLADDENTMLAHEPPEEHLEDYLNLVMSEYEALVGSLGSDKVLVFRGAPQSVRGLAERMRRLTTRYVSVELVALRRRFEPATGLDCSEIFADDTVHPLAAAAIAEEFLDSDAAARFEDGVRYFFGRRIPE